MKKTFLSLSIFAVAFVFTYIILSFGSWGLKLSAEPTVYFIESIKHMFLFKSIISCAAGTIASIVFAFIGKKESKDVEK